MHNELKQFPDSTYAGLPKNKAGDARQMALVSRKLKLPVDNKTGWTNSANKELIRTENTVPDVKGMGLRDALYLLEEQGLMVKPVGRGTVTHQSINAGTKAIRGQQIIIELS